MKLIKKNLKVIIAFISGGLVIGTLGVVAYSVYANTVTYDNTGSGLQSTDVQGAIDELYQKAASIPRTYYDFGEPTTSSTTDYTTLNKNVFVALNGTQKSVCITRNNKLRCFENNSFNYEKWSVQGVFNDISCSTLWVGNVEYINCDASDFDCSFGSNGLVYCRDHGADKRCYVYADNSVSCT